jgi:membrane fusion protein (multidrug efflux system)
MFVRATIDEGIHEKAILAPQQAVTRDPRGNPLALVVDAEGKVQLRILSTDRALGDKWLISSGLAQGDRLIVEGLQRVRPGMVVKAMPFATIPGNAAKAESPAGSASQSN